MNEALENPAFQDEFVQLVVGAGNTHAALLVEPVAPPVDNDDGQGVQALAPVVLTYVPTAHEKMPLTSRTAATPTVPPPGQYEPAVHSCTVRESNW